MRGRGSETEDEFLAKRALYIILPFVQKNMDASFSDLERTAKDWDFKKRFVMTFDDAIPTLEWFQILQHAWLIKTIFNFESLHHLERNTAFQHSIEHAFKGAFLSVIFHKSLNWDLTKTTASITRTLDTRSQGTFVHQTPVDPYRLLPRRHQNSKLLFTEGKVPVSINRQL